MRRVGTAGEWLKRSLIIKNNTTATCPRPIDYGTTFYLYLQYHRRSGHDLVIKRDWQFRMQWVVSSNSDIKARILQISMVLRERGSSLNLLLCSNKASLWIKKQTISPRTVSKNKATSFSTINRCGNNSIVSTSSLYPCLTRSNVASAWQNTCVVVKKSAYGVYWAAVRSGALTGLRRLLSSC